MRIAASLVTIACVVAIAVSACDDADPPEQPGSGGMAGAGGEGGAEATFADSACAACIDAACPNVINGCLAEPSCAGYLECVGACPFTASGNADEACVDACPEPSGSAAQEGKLLYDACRAGVAACEACGHITDQPHPYDDQMCMPSDNTNPCFKCVFENCCDTLEQCLFTNLECDAIIPCLTDCTDNGATLLDCHTMCFAQHPMGVEDYLIDEACWQSRCGDPADCGVPGTSACSACVDEKCDLEQIACNVNADCFLTLICASECLNDPNCDDYRFCWDGLPQEALDLYQARQACATNQCFLECEY